MALNVIDDWVGFVLFLRMRTHVLY